MKNGFGWLTLGTRWLHFFAVIGLVVLLAGCAGPRLGDHTGQNPVFDFKSYFNGPLVAHGMVSERGGKVLRRFVVRMQGEWVGDTGTLDEQFVYDDGERQKRVWTVTKNPDGSYSGTASDVVGKAIGSSVGPAFNWSYTLSLPIRGKTYEVQFDDWMYLIDERTVINRAYMSKFGINIGEVTLSFTKP